MTDKTPTPFRRKLALSLLSFAVMLVAGEVAVRVMKVPDKLSDPLPPGGPSLPWIAYSPTTGWINRPGFSGQHTSTQGEFSVSYEINSKGLRGPECGYEKTPGMFRILLIGDSFTFGHGVDGSNTYAAMLQHLVPNSEVLNGAVMGTGHDQQLLWLKEEGFKYKPDLIVWGYSSADIPRNTVVFRRLVDPLTGLDYAKPRFVLRNGTLELTHAPTPEPGDVQAAVEKYMAERRHERGSLVMALRKSRLVAATDDAIANLRERGEQLALASALADEFVRSVQAEKTPLLVVHLPVQKWLISRSPLNKLKRRMTEGILKKLAVDRRISILDLEQEFVAVGRNNIGTLFIKDGHYSPSGHRIVADAIARDIRASSRSPDLPNP